MESSLAARMQDLGDLELAILVALVAQEHCIFSTTEGAGKEFYEELRLSCTETFGHQPVVIQCSSKTTVDDFNEALLVEADEDLDDASDSQALLDRPLLSSVDFSSSRARTPGQIGSVGKLEIKRIAQVIIAVGLDTTDESVQVQAFELLRSRRIFTRSSMHVAPKDLLFLTVLSRPGARLFRHLNDVFCMSHFHPGIDGFPHLGAGTGKESMSIILPSDVELLREQIDHVFMTAEIAQYLHNVVVFMRNSRYVKGGVTATATRQMRILSMALAPLHGLDYVPPSLIALAARKIYPHRLTLVTAENEKSLLWGSDPAAVKELLQGMTVEAVIEDVLGSIEAPL